MTPEYKQAMEEKRERLRRLIPPEGKQSVTQGVNHVAVYCRDLEATARFYSEVMGMPVINVIDNRDVPESTHMNIDVGNEMAFSFFDFPHIPRLQEFAPDGVGNIMHIALPITPARYAEVKARLDERRIGYEESAVPCTLRTRIASASSCCRPVRSASSQRSRRAQRACQTCWNG